jgi:alpha-1,2-mannosyltransferase
MKTAVTAVLLAALAALTAVSLSAFGIIRVHQNDTAFVVCTAALWLLFGCCVFALFRVRGRAAIVLVLCGAIAVGGAALAGPPNTSTDSARYSWDGIVQNAGISPYRYVPASDALDTLRPSWLFPRPAPTASGAPECAGPRLRALTPSPSHALTCTAINRPKVPTIYPPAAEIFFAAVTFVTGHNAPYWPLQVTGLLLSLGITVLLIAAMRRRGMDPRWAALWAWSPFVTTEGITNSHVDMLATLFVVVASLAVARGFRFRGGIALGAAIATKLIPVIAAPALLRRQPWKVILSAVVTFAILYVPYVLATGIGVLGYLPGYLSEEGYDSGTRFTILTAIVPDALTLPIAALLLSATAVLVWWKTNPASPWLGQLVMIGTTLLIVSPAYPWYALMLIPFIALTRRWEWFAVPAALTVRLLIPNHYVSLAALSFAALVVVVGAIQRLRNNDGEDLRQSNVASGPNLPQSRNRPPATIRQGTHHEEVH